MWAAQHTLPLGDDADPEWGEYSEEKDEYFCPAGWYEMNQHEEQHWGVDGNVVAWCELPRLDHQCLAQIDEPAQPVCWIRFCSDGSTEGPIMHSQICEARKTSGAWTPLYAGAAPAAVAGPAWDKTRRDLAIVMMGFAGNPSRSLEVAEIVLDAATEPGAPMAYLRAPAAPALEAPAAPTAPDGWKLVPVEPTREMLDAYVREGGRFHSARADWAAMLAAAPALEAPAAPTAPWCPDVCPITGRPFFMWIEHHKSGQYVPTYGGPHDSYTLPVNGSDGSFECERYDHDRGGWLTDEIQDLGLMIVDDQSFIVAADHPRYNEVEEFANGAATFAAAKPGSMIAVPFDLIASACSAIDKKRDAPKTLAELRRYTTGDLSCAALAAAPTQQGSEASASGAKVLTDEDMEALSLTHGLSGDVEEMAIIVETMVLDRLAAAPQAPAPETVAWLNKPIKIEGGEKAGDLPPTVDFKRHAAGHEWLQAEPLVRLSDALAYAKAMAAAPQAPAAPSPRSAKELVRLADIMRDCGRLVSTSGNVERILRAAANDLAAAISAAKPTPANVAAPAAPALSAAPIPVMPRAITAGLGLDDSGEEPAYCVMVAFRQEDDARYALSILSAGLGATAAPAAGNWIAAEEVDRLVRDLDVALHGEVDAAPQASLCDIVGLAKAAAGKLGRPVLAAPAAPAVDASDDTALLDAMQRHRIALVPEFEGPWDAEIYDDDAEARHIASGMSADEFEAGMAEAVSKNGGGFDA
ncbi:MULTISPECIES: hypothetical protein [Delftia]|uniref:Uncharacterized protein n=1 Tax=Delftia lacustris TaxID=558537 RepID=A0A7T2YTH8_9BURK|nr:MULTISPECIES: hypothetical protein [Delftia]QPS81639.1 hypothetical protein I6G47_00710 [Delftia lacustris]